MNEAKVLRVTKTCKECKKPFSISEEELNWLKEKGLAPFERCSECRKKKEGSKWTQSIERNWG